MQEIITSPNSTAYGPVHTVQKVVGLPCCQAHCWLTFSLLSAKTPRVFSAKLLPCKAVSPTLYCGRGYFLLRERLWIYTS